MQNPIDALEVMICDTLTQAKADTLASEIRQRIQTWRERFGGEEVYIARRAHITRQQKIQSLMDTGLTETEISQRMGVSRQTVNLIKHKSRASSYL